MDRAADFPQRNVELFFLAGSTTTLSWNWKKELRGWNQLAGSA